VLAATLKGPRLAPGTRLINDLEDQDVYGVSGQQPPPIFRSERASPQVNQWLIRKRSVVQVHPGPPGHSAVLARDPDACPADPYLGVGRAGTGLL